MPETRPRLLYLGDVPVEASYHGSALLFRLLQRYPAERLRIIQSNVFATQTDRRLPGVHYETLPVGWTRLLRTRLHTWYSRWLTITAASRAREVPALLNGFSPEAVLTVAHGYLWMTAARFTEQTGVPLHLIVHDDWPRVQPAALGDRVEREFARVYRQASSRLCVSPFMAEEYERRYGVRGTVMLPARAPDAAVFEGCPERLQRGSAAVFAFAGSVNSPGYARLLQQLAKCLAPHHATLAIYGPLTPEQASANGLDQQNIRLQGLLPPADLLRRLRNDADVLFVPMSFADGDRSNMRMSFPSKLTDYTAVGVPMLICGPQQSSAVRWAEENAGVADVVTSAEPTALQQAVDRLCRDREYRLRLAARAQAIGHRDFSAAAAERTFHAALVA